MLNLVNVENNVRLKLLLVDYESPHSIDSNWCLVKAVVEQEKDYFEVIDPALETTDLQRILDWFKALAARKLPRYACLSFTEPCLNFKFLACKDESVRISIGLSHEMKPKFDLKQFGFSDSDWNIVFEISASKFSELIAELEMILKRYPIRDQA